MTVRQKARQLESQRARSIPIRLSGHLLFRSSRLHILMLAFWLSGLLASLTGCAANPDADRAVLGAETPEAAVTGFVTDLNSALQDAEIAKPEGRRSWSERLAVHFAASERADQRQALRQMLANYADGVSHMEETDRLVVEIDYTDTQVTQSTNDHALVHLTNARVRLRQIRARPNGRNLTIRDQVRPLAEMLGAAYDRMPVIMVDGRWFLTEG